MKRTLSLVAPAALIGVGLVAFLVVNSHWHSSDQGMVPTTTTTVADSSNQSVVQAISTGVNSGTHISGGVLVAIVVAAAVIALLSLVRRTEAAKAVTPRSLRRYKMLRELEELPPPRPPAKRWIEDFNTFVREHPELEEKPDVRLPGQDDPSPSP